jgi:hypothetical protein
MDRDNDDLLSEIEDRYDGVKELITAGKEKGYLLYDEVNDLLPTTFIPRKISTASLICSAMPASS